MPVFGFPSKSITVSSTGAAGSTGPFMTVERQCRANWCWAAVAVSIGRHYDVQRDQAEFARSVLASRGVHFPDSECIGQPCDSTSSLCSRPLPDLPLNKLPLQVAEPLPGPACETILREKLSAHRPVGLFIEWRSAGHVSGGHFIALTGIVISGSSLRYHVGDPMGPDDQTMTYDDLQNYQSDGKWMTTWLT
jgi:hypothetical protein